VRIVFPSFRSIVSVHSYRHRRQQSDQGEDAEGRAYRSRMRECGAIGDDCRETTNLRLSRIGKDAQDGLAFEVGDGEGDGGDAGNIRLSDWNDTICFDGNRSVHGTQAVNVGCAGVEGEIEAGLAVGKNSNVDFQDQLR
jgi:hypothetical protein